jgi:hypothetical protein
LPSEAIGAAARALLPTELDGGTTLGSNDDDINAQDSCDHTYRSVLIGHQVESGFVVHAVAILVGAGTVPEEALQLARRLGEFLQAIGGLGSRAHHSR